MPGRHGKQRQKRKKSRRERPTDMEVTLKDSIHNRTRNERSILKTLISPVLPKLTRKITSSGTFGGDYMLVGSMGGSQPISGAAALMVPSFLSVVPALAPKGETPVTSSAKKPIAEVRETLGGASVVTSGNGAVDTVSSPTDEVTLSPANPETPHTKESSVTPKKPVPHEKKLQKKTGSVATSPLTAKAARREVPIQKGKAVIAQVTSAVKQKLVTPTTATTIPKEDRGALKTSKIVSRVAATMQSSKLDKKKEEKNKSAGLRWR
eukprot:Tbor_TRINITY_DN5559_c1_g2::TRINITY_DN5559_c1_g2_i1::g.13198::m.13198